MNASLEQIIKGAATRLIKRSISFIIKHYFLPDPSLMTQNTLVKKSNKTSFLFIFIAMIVGALTGFVGSLFQLGVGYAAHYRIEHSQLFDNFYLNLVWVFLLAGLMGAFAYFMVQKVAPETSGSGIPEIEGAMLDLRPVRWHRVLITKFLGGFGALGSGMVLGREGPTVQMGANLGQMCFKLFRLDLLKQKQKEVRHALLATGAGAGITTAFNAPFGGILFVLEEMREEFKPSFISLQSVFFGCVSACVVYRLMISSEPILDLGSYSEVPLQSLWLYILIGAVFGVVGICSNQAILFLRKGLGAIYAKYKFSFVLMGFILGGGFGLLTLYLPEIAGGGFRLIPQVVDGVYALWPLLLICIGRFVTTVLCFGSGAPGGIFSPTLALGTVVGVFLGMICQCYFPEYHISLSSCAVIGMSCLFAASIRAPLTGMVIVLEMTNSYLLLLPLILACTTATLVAQYLKGQPLYTAILDDTLRKLGLSRPESSN